MSGKPCYKIILSHSLISFTKSPSFFWNIVTLKESGNVGLFEDYDVLSCLWNDLAFNTSQGEFHQDLTCKFSRVTKAQTYLFADNKQNGRCNYFTENWIRAKTGLPNANAIDLGFKKSFCP